jgi:hypothetical protein
METSLTQTLKLSLMSITGLGRDALHVYAGLGILFISAAVFRLPLARFRPLLFVLIAACLVEIADMRDDLDSFGRWRWDASLHDIVNTMFWPIVICAIARYSTLMTKK